MKILVAIMFVVAIPFSLLTAVAGVGLVGSWIELYQQSGIGAALVGGIFFVPICIVLIGFLPWLCTMGYLLLIPKMDEAASPARRSGP